MRTPMTAALSCCASVLLGAAIGLVVSLSLSLDLAMPSLIRHPATVGA